MSGFFEVPSLETRLALNVSKNLNVWVFLIRYGKVLIIFIYAVFDGPNYQHDKSPS